MLPLGLGSMEQRHVGKWITGWCKSFIRIRADHWRRVGCRHPDDDLDYLGLRLIAPPFATLSLQTDNAANLGGEAIEIVRWGSPSGKSVGGLRTVESVMAGMLQTGGAESATSANPMLQPNYILTPWSSTPPPRPRHATAQVAARRRTSITSFRARLAFGEPHLAAGNFLRAHSSSIPAICAGGKPPGVAPRDGSSRTGLLSVH